MERLPGLQKLLTLLLIVNLIPLALGIHILQYLTTRPPAQKKVPPPSSVPPLITVDSTELLLDGKGHIKGTGSRWSNFQFQKQASILFPRTSQVKLTCTAPYPTKWDSTVKIVDYKTPIVRNFRDPSSSQEFIYISTLELVLVNGSTSGYVSCESLDSAFISQLNIYGDEKHYKVQDQPVSHCSTDPNIVSKEREHYCELKFCRALIHAGDDKGWSSIIKSPDPLELVITNASIGLVYTGNLASAEERYSKCFKAEERKRFVKVFANSTLTATLRPPYSIFNESDGGGKFRIPICKYETYYCSNRFHCSIAYQTRDQAGVDKDKGNNSLVIRNCPNSNFPVALYKLNGVNIATKEHILITPSRNDYSVGENVTFKCEAVTFRFSPQIIFEVKRWSGPVTSLNSLDEPTSVYKQVASKSVTVTVDGKMKSISCFVPRVDSRVWREVTLPITPGIRNLPEVEDKSDIRKSRSTETTTTTEGDIAEIYLGGDTDNNTKANVPVIAVAVRQDPGLDLFEDCQEPDPELMGRSKGMKFETVDVEDGEFSLTCPPFMDYVNVTWIPPEDKCSSYQGQGVVEVSGEKLTFNSYDESLSGNYICRRTGGNRTSPEKMFGFSVVMMNQTKNNMKLDQEDTGRNSTTLIIIIAALAGCVLLVIVLLGLYCGGLYFRSKRQLRRLMCQELQDFKTGKCNKSLRRDNSISGGVSAQMVPFDKEITQSDIMIELGRIIEKDEFMSVLPGTMRGRQIIVKTTDIDTTITFFKAFLKDIKVMSYVGQHPHIAEFLGADISNIQDRVVFAVFEASTLGDVKTFLRVNSKNFVSLFKDEDNVPAESPAVIESDKVLNTLTLLNWCDQITTAMQHLERSSLIHGDLCASNVLIFPSNHIQISDLCSWRKDYEREFYLQNFKPPPSWRWMAIELFRQKRFTLKTDIWALGVTFWEIFSLGDDPYPGLRWAPTFVLNLESGIRMERPKFGNKKIYEMLLRCWYRYPNDRSGACQLKETLQDCMGKLQGTSHRHCAPEKPDSA